MTMKARAENAQLRALEAQISTLQNRQARLRKKQRGPVIASIVKSMHAYAITLDDLQAAVAAAASRPGRGRKRATAPAAVKPKATVAPKYRHPKTGETWSGRGKAPRWLAAAEAGGADRQSFLIT